MATAEKKFWLEVELGSFKAEVWPEAGDIGWFLNKLANRVEVAISVGDELGDGTGWNESAVASEASLKDTEIIGARGATEGTEFKFPDFKLSIFLE